VNVCVSIELLYALIVDKEQRKDAMGLLSVKKELEHQARYNREKADMHEREAVAASECAEKAKKSAEECRRAAAEFERLAAGYQADEN
jgi:hypothetical protein